jgi:signal transduction histidine kinase
MDADVLGAVLVTLDASSLSEHEEDLALAILGVLGLLCVTVGAATLYGLRRIVVKPILELRTSAKGISEGDYGARAEAKSADELGALARTFNEMAQRVEARTSEIQELNAHLEHRVRVRTAEVEQLLKQKDELMHRMGHDLKSPLVPILGLLPMMRKEETDPDRLEILDIAIERALYMQQLVTQVLKLARRGAAASPPQLVSVDLSGEIRDVVRVKRSAAQQKGVGIVNEATQEITVRAEKLGLSELVDNLLGNAIKYTPEGGAVTIEARADGDFATVSVRDTGIGMTEEQVSHMFEEFYRADEQRSELDSSGLGLAICKRIIEQHGGAIWAESPGLGHGTTVCFTLPLAEAQTSPEDTSVQIA